MRKKFKIIIMLAVCTLAALAGAAWATYEADRDEGAEAVLKAFNQSGASFERFQASGWTTLTPVSSEDQAEQYFKGRVEKIFGQEHLPAIVRSQSNGSLVLKAYGPIGPGIDAVATLQSKNQKLSNTPFLILSLTTKNPKTSYRKMHRILDTFLINPNNHKSSVISGKFLGIIPQWRANQIMEKMLHINRASQVETTNNGQIISVTAYSAGISKQLTYEEKSVNINMALRYNFFEKNTLLYIGSPIITSEY